MSHGGGPVRCGERLARRRPGCCRCRRSRRVRRNRRNRTSRASRTTRTSCRRRGGEQPMPAAGDAATPAAPTATATAKATAMARPEAAARGHRPRGRSTSSFRRKLQARAYGYRTSCRRGARRRCARRRDSQPRVPPIGGHGGLGSSQFDRQRAGSCRVGQRSDERAQEADRQGGSLYPSRRRSARCRRANRVHVNAAQGRGLRELR